MVEIVRAAPIHASLVVKAVHLLHGKPSPDAEALMAFIADPSCIFLLAIEDGNPVGSLYGYALRRPETDRPKFFLYEMDVIESHQRQGIGRALINEFLDEARRQNAMGMWVQAKSLDARAQAFYEACGGTREEEGDILFAFETK